MVRGSEKEVVRGSANTPVIPAKRSASRNPGRFAGYVLNLQQRHLHSRPGLLSAGVTFFRGNDGTEVQDSAKSALF